MDNNPESAEEPVEERPTSVVFDHCKNIYDEMLLQAREEPDLGMVYEGHLTKVFAQHKIATPYYTTVMRHLKAMACVEQLQRGGGNAPSRWRLLREPDEDAYKSIESINRSKTSKTAVMEQQLRDINKRLLAAESTLDNMKAAMGSILSKLHDMEQLEKVSA
jgi:hypothetical protein